MHYANQRTTKSGEIRQHYFCLYEKKTEILCRNLELFLPHRYPDRAIHKKGFRSIDQNNCVYFPFMDNIARVYQY